MKPVTLLLLFWLTVFHATGQDAIKPRPSPLAITTLRYKDAYLKITYGQPHKNGREIFGKLVPYDVVWRTGANEATELTCTKDILINNVLLKAGTYSLFSIPGKERWTIILNRDLGLWGAYNYNAKVDVFRFNVPVNSISEPVYEAFTIKGEQKNELAELLLLWDKTKVVIPIKFTN
ncbi:MAG: DUF2911 domain-containing protein [Cyclobacteriaceae bacterium]|nr:DUF2911 domain-containing protein [Cyclobacteriaceae bacterium]